MDISPEIQRDMSRLRWLEQGIPQLINASDKIKDEINASEKSRQYSLHRQATLSQRCAELEAQVAIIQRTQRAQETEVETIESGLHALDEQLSHLESSHRVLKYEHSVKHLTNIEKLQEHERENSPEKLNKKIAGLNNKLKDLQQIWKLSQAPEGRQELINLQNESTLLETHIKSANIKLQEVKATQEHYSNVVEFLLSQRFFAMNLHLMGFSTKGNQLYTKISRLLSSQQSQIPKAQNDVLFPTPSSFLSSTPGRPPGRDAVRELLSLQLALSPMNTILAILRPWGFLQPNLLTSEVLANLPHQSPIIPMIGSTPQSYPSEHGQNNSPDQSDSTKENLTDNNEIIFGPISHQLSSQSQQSAPELRLPSHSPLDIDQTPAAQLHHTPWGISIDSAGVLHQTSALNLSLSASPSDNDPLGDIQQFSSPAISSKPQSSNCLVEQSGYHMNYSIYNSYRSLDDIQALSFPDLNRHGHPSNSGNNSQDDNQRGFSPNQRVSSSSSLDTIDATQSQQSSQTESHTYHPKILPRLLAYLYTFYSTESTLTVLDQAMQEFLTQIPLLQQCGLLPSSSDFEGGNHIPYHNSGDPDNPLVRAYQQFFTSVRCTIDDFVTLVSTQFSFDNNTNQSFQQQDDKEEDEIVPSFLSTPQTGQFQGQRQYAQPNPSLSRVPSSWRGDHLESLQPPQLPQYRPLNPRQTPQYQTPQYSSNQTPRYQDPQYDQPQFPQCRPDQTPQYRPHQHSQYQTNQTPQYQSNQTPQYQSNQTPQYQAHQTPQYQARQTHQTPQYPPNQTPQYRSSQEQHRLLNPVPHSPIYSNQTPQYHQSNQLQTPQYQQPLSDISDHQPSQQNTNQCQTPQYNANTGQTPQYQHNPQDSSFRQLAGPSQLHRTPMTHSASNQSNFSHYQNFSHNDYQQSQFNAPRRFDSQDQNDEPS